MGNDDKSSCVVLGDRNYAVWVKQFPWYVRRKDASCWAAFETPTVVGPAGAGVAAQRTVHPKSDEALALLHHKVDVQWYDDIAGLDANAAWSKLAELGTAGGLPRIAVLNQQLHDLVMGAGEDVATYFKRGGAIMSELQLLGHPYTDEAKVLVMLRGLPDEYETTRTVAYAQKPTHTMLSLRALLDAHEGRESVKIAARARVEAANSAQGFRGGRTGGGRG